MLEKWRHETKWNILIKQRITLIIITIYLFRLSIYLPLLTLLHGRAVHSSDSANVILLLQNLPQTSNNQILPNNINNSIVLAIHLHHEWELTALLVSLVLPLRLNTVLEDTEGVQSLELGDLTNTGEEGPYSPEALDSLEGRELVGGVVALLC